LSQASAAPSERFSSADEAYRQRADESKARAALAQYRRIFERNPDDGEAAWRTSMACYFVSIRLTKDAETRQKLYSEGRAAGLKSIKLVPQCAPCFFWTAINTALFGDESGSVKTYFLLSEIQDLLNKSIAIDPSYAYGGAYRLLGLIEWKLPGILGGSNSRAIDYFQKAIAVAPDEPLNFLFLAQLYENTLSDHKKARETAQKGLSVPPPSVERLEALDALNDLKKLLHKIDSTN
jgi:tetratricopeptide (TPR) repeat protein